MRRDITIAQVPWGVRDVTRIILMTFLIPYGLLIAVVASSHFHLLPTAITHSIKTNDIWFNLVFDMTVIIVEISMVIWLVKKYNITLGSLGLKSFSITRAIFYLISAVLLFSVLISIAFALVTLVFPHFNVNETQPVAQEFGTSKIGLTLTFISAVIIAPIIEEIYFRGIMLPALTKRMGWLFGVIISSGFFAILHMQANVIVYTFILGMFLCFMYIKLKSIIPGIILHSINNCLAFIAIFFIK